MTGNPIAPLNPAHKGSLTKIVGKKGLSEKNLSKTISSAKKSGNVKLEKKAVFAQNAKHWHHSKKPKEVSTDRGKFGMK